MCGLFGWNFSAEGHRILGRPKLAVLATALGMENRTRGTHSWGYYCINGERSWCDRDLGPFLGNCDTISAALTFMGHTRYATVGGHTLNNCHPFAQEGQKGICIGAHNGAVRNWSELETEYPERKHFGVDSQHVFQHLADGKNMRELEGYGAATWTWVASPRDMHVVKWNGGEFALMNINQGQRRIGIVWSSDHRHLQAACNMAGLRGGTTYTVDTEREVVLSHGRFRSLEKMVFGGQGYRTKPSSRAVTTYGGDDWDSSGPYSALCGEPLVYDATAKGWRRRGSTGGSTTGSTTDREQGTMYAAEVQKRCAEIHDKYPTLSRDAVHDIVQNGFTLQDVDDWVLSAGDHQTGLRHLIDHLDDVEDTVSNDEIPTITDLLSAEDQFRMTSWYRGIKIVPSLTWTATNPWYVVHLTSKREVMANSMRSAERKVDEYFEEQKEIRRGGHKSLLPFRGRAERR